MRKNAKGSFYVRTISGVASRDIWIFFAKQIGFAKLYFWLIGADLFLEKQSDINSFLGHILGFMTDMVMGAMLGITLGLLIEPKATKTAIAVNLGDSRLFKPGNLTLEIDQPQGLFPQSESMNKLNTRGE